ICNDVIGDICGVVSGTAGAAIIFRFFSGHAKYGLIEAVVGGLIAAITVGGKAFAKKFGIKDSHVILYKVGTLMAIFIPSNNSKKQEKG
ncbi:MAG TPA: Mg2+ and Co2+ transporter CorB, partial [Ruminiclostridium sp.]|nr:Mg2+ and Co2+ transporter CorB [Ruminiclostridium sp.]